METPAGLPVKLWGYQLAGTDYRQHVDADAGETIAAPAPHFPGPKPR